MERIQIQWKGTTSTSKSNEVPPHKLQIQETKILIYTIWYYWGIFMLSDSKKKLSFNSKR